MATLGKRNTLSILRRAPQGCYLDGGPLGEILLPNRDIPPDATQGNQIDVFLYRDSEDRLIATTRTPFAMVGEFAHLRVIAENPAIGAFLDWGLEKDLLLPRREYAGGVWPGRRIVVYVTLDQRSDRIIASARLSRWLDLVPATYVAGQAVKLLIESETPLGYKAIIENAHAGLLYRAELAAPLTIGQTIPGYIRTIRTDGKIDLGLDPTGHARLGPLSKQILKALKDAGGRLPYHDGTPPEQIRAALGMSKKAFKQAIGVLFRERRIRIEPTGIQISESGKRPSHPSHAKALPGRARD